MYIDDGSDSGVDGNLTVEVDGEEYSAAETVDFDHDGVADAAAVDTGDGGHLLYVDMDGDGIADEALTYDSSGDVTAAARFDSGSGDWVRQHVPGGSDDHSADTVSGGGDIRVDTADGTVDAGRPTVDSDGDGKDDTAIVHVSDGSTVLYTDVDGDGSADLATVIGADGSTETLRHTGEHEWTPVDGEQRDAGSSGGGGDADQPTDPTSDEFWGTVSGSSASAAGVVRIDATTGQWISPN